MKELGATRHRCGGLFVPTSFMRQDFTSRSAARPHRPSSLPTFDQLGRFILVTGGTRSGKSRFAVELAKTLSGRVAYIATCGATDQEMCRRIVRHRRARPKHWSTIEHPSDPAETLSRLNGKVAGVILDCLTMYVSELLVHGCSDAAIQKNVRRLCHAIRAVSCPVLVVTNEVGWGVVPEHALGRRFRDLAGVANQIAAGAADQVFLLVAGIPLELKGEG